jgi:hypothetical protein
MLAYGVEYIHNHGEFILSAIQLLEFFLKTITTFLTLFSNIFLSVKEQVPSLIWGQLVTHNYVVRKSGEYIIPQILTEIIFFPSQLGFEGVKNKRTKISHVSNVESTN